MTDKKKGTDAHLSSAQGDGNHSLATAKTCWENLKATLTDAEKENHPARFCLVENHFGAGEVVSISEEDLKIYNEFDKIVNNDI